MTTTLPPCPLCGSAAEHDVVDGASCDNCACAFHNHYFPEPSWLALCARLTPANWIAVPNQEIEALKSRVIQGRGTGIETCTIAPSRLDAIIARLPRKVDHVAQLEKIRAGFVMTAQMDPDGSQASIAALEAAIVRMRESER